MKFIHNNQKYELIILTIAGSHLYGNSRPESDWDYRGVFICDNDNLLGLNSKVEQIEGIEVYNSLIKAGIELEYTDDIVLYELGKFCKLAIGNPEERLKEDALRLYRFYRFLSYGYNADAKSFKSVRGLFNEYYNKITPERARVEIEKTKGKIEVV